MLFTIFLFLKYWCQYNIVDTESHRANSSLYMLIHKDIAFFLFIPIVFVKGFAWESTLSIQTKHEYPSFLSSSQTFF